MKQHREQRHRSENNKMGSNVSVLKVLLCVLCLYCGAFLTGCNIAGPAAYIIHGPPKVDAEHKIADRPTVVFIDDRENVVNPTMLRRVIAEKVSEELMVQKVVKRTISPHDAMSLAAAHDTSKEVMPIDAVGRAVGAEQVIYIEMAVFDVRPQDQIPRPTAVCRVRVIDVTNRQRLYPPPGSDVPYRELIVRTREIDTQDNLSRAAGIQIRESLAIELGDRIAKLFYRHESRELGATFSDRQLGR